MSVIKKIVCLCLLQCAVCVNSYAGTDWYSVVMHSVTYVYEDNNYTYFAIPDLAPFIGDGCDLPGDSGTTKYNLNVPKSGFSSGRRASTEATAVVLRAAAQAASVEFQIMFPATTDAPQVLNCSGGVPQASPNILWIGKR